MTTSSDDAGDACGLVAALSPIFWDNLYILIYLKYLNDFDIFRLHLISIAMRTCHWGIGFRRFVLCQHRLGKQPHGSWANELGMVMQGPSIPMPGA